MVQKLLRNESRFELGYWAIRGLAQPIRFLLTHSGVIFSETRYGIEQDGRYIENEIDDWDSEKNNLGLALPNLPYLFDYSKSKKIGLSQSNSILRYLGRELGYYGSSDEEQIQIDMLQDEAYDLRSTIVETAYTLGSSYVAKLENFRVKSAPKYLNIFEAYLAKKNNKKYFVGNQITLVDFVIYELLWQVCLMVPEEILQKKYKSLNYFTNNFESIESIAEYRNSEEYLDRPINSVWASFK